MTVIRDAIEADMAAVTDIYNSYLSTTTAAWSEREQTIDERIEWFRSRRSAGHPVLVAVDPKPGEPGEPGKPVEHGEHNEHDEHDGPGLVVGFTGCGPFRGAGMWPGYVHTAELTIFVAEPRLGTGVGDLLMGALVDRATTSDLHVLVAGIDGDNIGSIHFHERWGFTEVARMPEVGRKWDRWLDLVLMQRTVD